MGVNYYTLNNVGPITISGQTSPENLRKALKALEAAKAKDPKSANSQPTPGYLLQNRGF